MLEVLPIGRAGRLSLRPHHPGDEGLFEARADFAAAYAAEGRRLPAGLKWTLTRGSRAVGVAGLEPLGAGRWGAWAYLAPLGPREWASAALAARRVLSGLEPLGLGVVQAVPEPAQPGARRVLEKIGFAGAGEVMKWKGRS